MTIRATCKRRLTRPDTAPDLWTIVAGAFAPGPTRVNSRGMTLHMIKLCVGCDTVEELLDWRKEHSGQAPEWRLRTRQTPKRAGELIDGGSLYRVFKGLILCRQDILKVETVGEGVQARCEIVLGAEVVQVTPAPRRAFQGWRYLTTEDAPPDLSSDGDMLAVPPALVARLREIGAW